MCSEETDRKKIQRYLNTKETIKLPLGIALYYIGHDTNYCSNFYTRQYFKELLIDN